MNALLQRVRARAKESGLLKDVYDISFIPSDDTETEMAGEIVVPLGSIPLLRNLFRPRVEAYEGAIDDELLDAASVAGVVLPGQKKRTVMGFETLYGYQPREIRVTKTAAARAWYRLGR